MVATFWIGVKTEGNELIKLPVKMVYFFPKKAMTTCPDLVVDRTGRHFSVNAKSNLVEFNPSE